MPSQIGRIKRLSLLLLVASGLTADAPMVRLSPFEIAVNTTEGQLAGLLSSGTLRSVMAAGARVISSGSSHTTTSLT